jgi:LysM repeat protein
MTETPTITLTPTETTTTTPASTWTPLPPLEYTVRAGDVCSGIAALFSVSIQAIVTENNLSSSCLISEGQVLRIPQPTPTASPMPTASLTGPEATLAACPTDRYTVQANDTLSIIANNYSISMEAIKEWNGLTTDNVYLGQTLTIPLCMRAATPGPTPTPTLPPPYPAPNLLLPPDGAPFNVLNETVTLQWASIGELRQNEAYLITVEDITSGTGRKLVDYAQDTSYIIPISFRPQDNIPHIMRWWVTTVRQSGSDENGNPIWMSAGSSSIKRAFTWSGAEPAATPIP